MKTRLAAAIALAGAVMTLTPAAWADEAAPEAPASSGTPLTLRPEHKPLQLAPEPHHVSAGWKMVALVALLGGTALWLRKKARPARLDDTRLNIVRRASVGFRSELVVVEVEGQRLLLGVTPQSIQSLAILDGADVSVSPPRMASSRPAAVAEKFDALLDAADRLGPTPDETHAEALPLSEVAKPEVTKPAPEDVAGQARGLLGLRGRR